MLWTTTFRALRFLHFSPPPPPELEACTNSIIPFSFQVRSFSSEEWCIGTTKRVNINIKTNTTLEYLITVQHLINVQKGKLDFIWLAKKDNLMLLDQCKTFSINLNAQHVNGMTPFDVRLLDPLE